MTAARRIVAKILLAEDHNLIRDGIRSLLEGAGAVIVGEAPDGHAAVSMAQSLKPDVVLMDVGMPVLNGIEATRQIHQSDPDVHVVVLSMHTEPEYIYESVRAGASGYVLKDAALEELLTAIETALTGRTYLSPAAAELAIFDYVRRAKGDAAPNEMERLSIREREVLQLIAEGRSSAEIGKALKISARTADTHRQNLMQKLGLRSIAGLTKFAIRHGLATIAEAPSRKGS